MPSAFLALQLIHGRLWYFSSSVTTYEPISIIKLLLYICLYVLLVMLLWRTWLIWILVPGVGSITQTPLTKDNLIMATAECPVCQHRVIWCVYMVSHVWLFATPWTVAHQASLSMNFSRQEYWSGCHFLLQGIFLTQGSKPHLVCLLHWQVDSLPLLRLEPILNSQYGTTPQVQSFYWLLWTTPIMEGPVFCPCWNRYLLWMQICISCMQCFCQNYHLGTQRIPYSPSWYSTQYCFTSRKSLHSKGGTTIDPGLWKSPL